MTAVVIALCCAGLAVVALRREGRPVTFVGDDFRTLVAHDTYTVDWATGTVADAMPIPLEVEFSFGLDLLIKGLSQIR